MTQNLDKSQSPSVGSTQLLCAEEVLQAIEKAHDMVTALCKPKGSEGSREWIMSIPAQPDYDPDLIISNALSKAEKFIKQST